MRETPFDVNIVPEVQGQLLETSRGVVKPEKKLEAMLDISRKLASAKAVEEILPSLLDTLLTDVFPFAGRGSILLLDAETGNMVPTAQQHKHAGGEATVELSRTVLDLVMQQKVGVRSIDAAKDERFQMASSIMLSEIQSMLCVPMLSLDGSPIGIIHLDSQSTFATFSAADQALLEAIAGQAALSYESARQMQRAEQIRSEMEIARHAALSQMVSGLAHELNTPLGIMAQASGVIGEAVRDASITTQLDEEGRESLQDAAEALGLLDGNLARASRLITEFKKLSARQLADTREAVSLSQLVDEVVAIVRAQDKHRQHDIVVQKRVQHPEASWEGYPGNLTQVLFALFDNVAHAYSGGAGVVEVWLSDAPVEGGGAGYLLQIRDHGAGMSPEQQQQCFVPFFTTQRHRGHRGLGLSIVYQIVRDSLRGAIQLETHLGRGTLLSMSLPAVVPS